GLDSKLTGFQTASKDLDSLLESQILDKNKEGLGYSAVPPPPAQIYSPLKNDMSWTGLPEFKDNTVTDYSRRAPTVESSPDDAQNRNLSVTETKASPSTISPKSFIKAVPKTTLMTKSIGTVAALDECMLWHRRHLNFKTMNKLVIHNLVRGLPTKCFENDYTCTACLKGKQHKASCKSKLVNSISKPLHTLHMDLFGPTSVSSISHKWYCLVVTNDFSRLTWTFFLKTKDETSGILRKFITEIENLKDLKVKIIRCDNGGEFMNKEMNDFCSQKGIKREFSNVRTPQHNGVAERRNMTLIEAARTMLADAKLPITFWAKAVNIASYVQNRTPYELFNGRTPAIGFLKPFGCHVMFLNTLDNFGKFEAKGDEGTNSTNLLGTKDAASQEVKKDVSSLRYIAIPNWVHDALLESSSSKPQDDCSTDVFESSGNFNPTATSTNPPADQLETLTVETPIPNNIFDAIQDPSWVEAMQEELLQFKIQNVWTLVDCPKGEEGIDYDEVFAPVTRIETIRLFLAYASLMGFTVYQMDVKSTFLYGTIDEEVEVPVLSCKYWNGESLNMSDVMLSMPCEALSKKISPSILRFNKIMARLQFCDYHNMVAILEKSEHNVNFHPIVDFVKASPLRRARIAQSLALLPIADEPASPLRDVSQGEACPTNSGFGADQDRANIAKTSTLPYDSVPRVTSHAADEGKRFRDDAPIKGRNLDEGEAVAERVSDDTEEMTTVLTSMDAATILASGVAKVSTGSGSIPTGSDVVPTAGLIFATATVVTPYTRRKGKETMVESETPKKKKVARDAEIARIHAEEELQIMIDGLDRKKDYPLRKGLAIAMISYKLQVKTYSKMENDLILKIYKIASSQRQQVMEFPLPEEVLTASEESSHCQKKRDASAVKIALLLKSRRNCQSKSYDSFAKLVPHVTLCILGITVKTYSKMANDLTLKICKIASSPGQQGD
nr:retrovirus-related Pol polyprotein from transposon TNT 1-94 [Tanacetum cinerariifolium]